MRERVEQMGGKLEITSSRGKGTKITVVLPSNGETMSGDPKRKQPAHLVGKPSWGVRDIAARCPYLKAKRKNLVSRYSSLMTIALSAKAWFHSLLGKQT